VSVWIWRKDRMGKRQLWLIDTDPTVLMALWAVCFVLIISHPESFVAASLMIMASGAVCFTLAKVSLFRRGVWMSWDSTSMTKRNANLYRTGYFLMAGGALLYFLARLLIRA